MGCREVGDGVEVERWEQKNMDGQEEKNPKRVENCREVEWSRKCNPSKLNVVRIA